jgi:hypothetical protein
MWITNVAFDVDLPADGLAFSLGPVPEGVFLDRVTGIMTWTPEAALAGTTHTVAVVVTDQGTPPLSDTREFQVTVGRPPVLASIRVASGQVALTWSAIPGLVYRVQRTGDLAMPEWAEVEGDVQVEGSVGSITVPEPGSRQFYRVMALRP